jgi:hypothetical protein
MAGHQCTAGGVFQSSTRVRTAFQAAVRYVLTAGHCGELGDVVKVGGVDIGVVSWRSSTSDLLLVKVDPSVTRRTACSRNSFGVVACSLIDVPATRAASRALLPSFRARTIASVPVERWATAGYTDPFCTSGRTTGVICGWEKRPWSTTFHGEPGPGEEAAESPNGFVTAGDSGSPVVSLDGTLHGIASSVMPSAVPGAPSIPDVMTYTTIAQFLQETDHAYVLAPS